MTFRPTGVLDCLRLQDNASDFELKPGTSDADADAWARSLLANRPVTEITNPCAGLQGCYCAAGAS